jgi:hypothetical protein
MGRVVVGIAPDAKIVKVSGAITPAGTAVMVPDMPGANPNPVTVTVVPSKPMVGERVMVGVIPTV